MNTATADEWLYDIIARDARWSADQLDIYNWFEDGAGNLLVRARAGTGKTTTLIEGVQRAPERSILLAAFNKSIAEELTRRVPARHVQAKTLHSLGMRCILQNWRVKVDRDRATSLARAVLSGSDAPREAFVLVRDLHTKAREIAPWFVAIDDVAERNDKLAGLAAKFDLLPDKALEAKGWSLDRVCSAAFIAMQLARERTDAIDFADMIYLPLVHDWVQSSFDMVVIDEAQDMTSAQLAIATGSCAHGGRVVVVGDDRQAIYQFRGAELDGVEMLKRELHAVELGLRTTYRCPRLVVELAARLVPDYVAAPGAPDGEIVSMAADGMIAVAKPGDFVLSRTNAPLVRVCIALLKHGTRARVKGSDVAKQVLTLVEKLAANSVAVLANKVRDWLSGEIDRARNKLHDEALDERVAQVTDLASLVLALLEDTESLAEFDRRTRELFSEEPGLDVVMCSTVHRAKGLETDTVFLLRDTFRDGSLAEDNIMYVAITRTKRRLVWVDGEVS